MWCLWIPESKACWLIIPLVTGLVSLMMGEVSNSFISSVVTRSIAVFPLQGLKGNKWIKWRNHCLPDWLREWTVNYSKQLLSNLLKVPLSIYFLSAKKPRSPKFNSELLFSACYTSFKLTWTTQKGLTWLLLMFETCYQISLPTRPDTSQENDQTRL